MLELLILTIRTEVLIPVPAGFQDWDKPETIPDPDAKKPDDWDEDMDGEWEPPMITNPEYKVRLLWLKMWTGGLMHEITTITGVNGVTQRQIDSILDTFSFII